MSDTYRDRDGDQWSWDAIDEGYTTRDMWGALPLETVREEYGPLEVWDTGTIGWVREPETQEQLLRRIIREELDQRLGKVHP
ncbi:hypothetical protein ACIPJG_32530 [Streptomyces halstedii]|uniref:hypothetical protein n=1 Tax=Streptomyces halstedii TaxID=1944 RepID=UPI003809FE0E